MKDCDGRLLLAERTERAVFAERTERPVFHYDLFRPLRRERPRKQVALRVRAAEARQLAGLYVALDPFGNHARVQRAREREDALDNGGTSRNQQTVHERAIDLQRVDG